MKKWTFIIDVAKCHDCNNCFLACKDEFCDNDHLPYSISQPNHGHRWMNIQRTERGQYPRVDVGYLSQPCMHCDEPACLSAAENGSIYKRDDGIVIIDPVKSKGQKNLVESCPYHAIWWNEEKQIPQKCTFCAHLLDNGWAEPRCVQSCPTGAMSVHLLDDVELNGLVTKKKLEVYQPQLNTKPRVYYKNLYRFTRCFISGSAALSDVDECAEGAVVTVSGIQLNIDLRTETNNYGDFKIDDLIPDGQKIILQLEYPGYEKQIKNLKLTDSIDLGTIHFLKNKP
jgi:Fe-S-cluster-containing dehydrogenase component